MKIGIKTKRKLEQNTYLAVDIGTANIKTTLFYIEDKEIHVIGYNRMPQKPFSMNKAVILDTEEVSNTLDKSIGMAIAQAESLDEIMDFKLPREVVIGIAGELVSGVPIIVNIERDNPDKKISHEEIETVLEKVKMYSFESTKDEIAEESGLSVKQIAEVDTVMNSISIDGVSTKKPVGLSGNEINYRVFTSFAPKLQIESIENIAEELRLELHKIAVEPYYLANNLEDITNNVSGGIVLDVGAGTTDIAIVKNFEVLGIKMFAIGGSNFTKRIARDLGVEYEEAELLKLEYSNGTLKDTKAKQVIRKAVVEDVRSWLLGIELALDEIDDIDEMPHTFYLCGGGSMLPEMRDGILEYPWSKSLPFPKHPHVEMVYPNKVVGIVDHTNDVKELFDTTPLTLTKAILE